MMYCSSSDDDDNLDLNRRQQDCFLDDKSILKRTYKRYTVAPSSSRYLNPAFTHRLKHQIDEDDKKRLVATATMTIYPFETTPFETTPLKKPSSTRSTIPNNNFSPADISLSSSAIGSPCASPSSISRNFSPSPASINIQYLLSTPPPRLLPAPPNSPTKPRTQTQPRLPNGEEEEGDGGDDDGDDNDEEGGRSVVSLTVESSCSFASTSTVQMSNASSSSLHHHHHHPQQQQQQQQQKIPARYDSSLVALTKKFVSKLQNSPNKTVDLNQFASELSGVRKRRLYDVTNVLEGIGIIKKLGKNYITWNDNPPLTTAEMIVASEGEAATATEEKENGDDTLTESCDDASGCSSMIVSNNKAVASHGTNTLEEMKKKLKELNNEEAQVNRFLDYLNYQAEMYHGDKPVSPEFLANFPPDVVATVVGNNVAGHMYLSYQDLTAIPPYMSGKVVGIRAPTGAVLQVPDPDQGMRPGERRYELYMNSNRGAKWSSKTATVENSEPIIVYAVKTGIWDSAQQPVGENMPKKVSFCPSTSRTDNQIEGGNQKERGEDSQKGKKGDNTQEAPSKRVPPLTSSEKRKKPPQVSNNALPHHMSSHHHPAAATSTSSRGNGQEHGYSRPCVAATTHDPRDGYPVQERSSERHHKFSPQHPPGQFHPHQYHDPWDPWGPPHPFYLGYGPPPHLGYFPPPPPPPHYHWQTYPTMSETRPSPPKQNTRKKSHPKKGKSSRSSQAPSSGKRKEEGPNPTDVEDMHRSTSCQQLVSHLKEPPSRRATSLNAGPKGETEQTGVNDGSIQNRIE